MDSKKKGFTLIELMVVVMIIMTLASLVIISVSRARVSSRDAKRIADLGSISSALQQYYVDNRAYPSGNYTAMVTTLNTGGYLSTTSINDPKSGASYTYLFAPGTCTTASNNCTSYVVYATLEDNSKATVPSTFDYALKNGEVSNTKTP